ncbi:DUF6893 family small protein [Streptomyces fungicidicus]|jgi:hypothetical protein|nr:hypothetical protein FBY37_0331 [Streptomyces sp. SLBN-134]
MSKRLIGGAAAVLTMSALVAVAANVWPDVRRYLRIRSM